MSEKDDLAPFLDGVGNVSFSLKKGDVEALFSSSDKVGLIQDVEALYDALLVSFIEFKSLVYKKTLESSLWPKRYYKEAHNTRVELNVALASVLNSGRLLTDKLQGSQQEGSILKDLGGNLKSSKHVSKVVGNALSDKYEGNSYYLIMYLSRNFLQHSGIVIDNIRREMSLRHDGFYERKLTLLLDLDVLKRVLQKNISNLKEKSKCDVGMGNRKLKCADGFQRKLDRLNLVKEPVHLLVALEGYINSIMSIMGLFRKHTSEIYNTALETHALAVKSVIESLSHINVPRGFTKPYLPMGAKVKGRIVPFSLEWNMVEYLRDKNTVTPSDYGLVVISMDYGRRSGYYDRFYKNLGLVPPK